MDELIQNLRFAFRQIRYSLAFSFFIIATLALGIGANTTIFGAANAVLLRPLPYPESERLVQLSGSYVGRGDDWSVSLPNAVDWGKMSRSFTAVAYFQGTGLSLAGETEPERVEGIRASPNLFTVLGAKPARGRLFTAAEDQPGTERVVVISHELWQRRFAGDPQIVGQSINLSGNPATIIGVMPAGFGFPSARSEIYLPVRANETTWNRFSGGLSVVGKLKPGVTLEQARADLRGVSRRLADAYPDSNKELSAHLVPFRQALFGGKEIQLVVYLLLGAVGFVLLIACVNVANLLLARSTSREREIAIRAAIGADRSRVIRQLLTESMVLAALGGVAGTLLALWGTSAIERIVPEDVPFPVDFGVDARVLGFTALLSLFTGLLFGLAPALHASSTDLLSLLGGRTGAASRRRKRRRNLLVVAEVALASILLVSAGLMVRSLGGLLQNDPGFNTENVLTFRVPLDAKYDSANKVLAFQRSALAALRQQSGVRNAGVVDFIPLGGTNNYNDFMIEGSAEPKPQNAGTLFVSPGYFDAMQIQLLQGRQFDERDVRAAPGVAVVNRAFARQFLGGDKALGKRIRLNWGGESNYWRTVVGIVNDVRHSGLNEPPRPEAYIPYAQMPFAGGAMTFVVRTQQEPTTLLPAARQAIWSIDRALPLFDVRTMERVLRDSGSVFIARILAGAVGVFGIVALLLAALGLYGVISYHVAQRTYEIGVRSALGAEKKDVLKLVIWQGMALVLAGLGLGLIGAVAVGRVMRSLLYGVSATDAVSFAGMSTVLIAVALLATYLPARRAARIDPLTALRAE